ncbi:glycerophosphodiester phosphodiesterase [Brevibacterium litoralis]|uniref:glycerophosphodiester phosphodiesterase n=1 Tax=Brevibacterium litoralis TaxID=3138935 RepID=UPI0032ECCE80
MNFGQYVTARTSALGTARPGGGSKPWVIAHRGYSGAAPENTMAAFDAAQAIGAEFIEIDLGLTADGTPVVIHDSTINRTTNLQGRVSDLTDESLSLADAGSWMGPGFAGQRVPALRTVLEDLHVSGGDVLLEFKDDWSPGAIAHVARDVVETRTADRVLIQSFSVRTLEVCRDLLPMVPRALLRLVPRPDDKALLEELDAVGYNLSLRGFLARRQVAEEFMAAGYGVFVWTVNEAPDWEKVLGAGVHGIITDQPARLQGYLSAKFD